MSILDLARELADVKRRLAVLEQAQQPPAGAADQLNPNAFFINAEGQIEERLTGKLEAQGITFSEVRIFSPTPTSRITWGTPARPTLESITGYLKPAVGEEPEEHRLDLQAVGTPAGAFLYLASILPASAKVSAECREAAVQILDEKSRSSFLQLAGTPEKVLLQWGTGELEWPGASENSNILTINLPFAATAGARVWLTPNFAALGFYVVGSQGIAANQLKVSGTQPGKAPAAGSKAAFNYLILSPG